MKILPQSIITWIEKKLVITTKKSKNMEEVDIQDPDGSVMHLRKYKGRLYGPEHPENFEERDIELESLGFTKDDVLISSYPKSGTHWISELTNMLLNKSTDYLTKTVPLFDIATFPSLKERYGNSDAPRQFMSHFPSNLLPKKMLENKTRIIHIYRNPKDVAVSFFEFIRKLKVFESYKNAEWRNFLKHYMDGEVLYGDWYSFMKEWKDFQKENPDYPILWLNYEEMKMDATESMQKLARFLDVSIDEQLIAEIIQKCDFKAMHSHKNINPPPMLAKITDRKENIFYRKGEVGDWKNWFTVAQNEEFDRRMEPLLKTLDMKCRYSL